MFFPKKMKNDIITSCASTISIDSTTKNSPYTIDGEIFNSNGKNITIDDIKDYLKSEVKKYK